MKNNIILGTEEDKCFDKMQIALAIRNSTFEEWISLSDHMSVILDIIDF